MARVTALRAGRRARVAVEVDGAPWRTFPLAVVTRAGLVVGLERKIVQKSGSYFSFGDERLGQGRQNATAFLREHPDVAQQILARIQVEVGAEQPVSARLLPTAQNGTAAAQEVGTAAT